MQGSVNGWTSCSRNGHLGAIRMEVKEVARQTEQSKVDRRKETRATDQRQLEEKQARRQEPDKGEQVDVDA
jgi:hypothetical protein